MKKLLTMALVATLALGAFAMSFASDNNYGSAAVLASNETFTLEEMLTYAIQDEYSAKAEYAAIMEAFDVSRPFSNILQAEQYHIELLTPLFAAYGYTVPEDNAADHAVIPATLEETYQIGVDAEIANIEMYQKFLAQNDLSDDVRVAFNELMSASQNHLQAFERQVERADGRLNGQGQTDVRGYGDEQGEHHRKGEHGTGQRKQGSRTHDNADCKTETETVE